MKIGSIQILVGLGSAFLFLALSLHQVPLAAIHARLFGANSLWLAAAIFVCAVDLFLRAWCWQIILRAAKPVSYLAVMRALVVGYGLNAIMPLRLGEPFRAAFCKKDFGLPRPWALISIVVERLFDGLTAIVCLGAGLFLADATGRISRTLTGVLATAGLIFGGGLLVPLALSGSVLSRTFARFPRLAAQMAMVERSLSVLCARRIAGLIAAGLGLSLGNMLVLVGAASLGTLLPSGPALLGTSQFTYALAIGFAGASRELGIAAATLAQLFVLLPLATIAAGVLLRKSGRLLLGEPATGEASGMPAGF